MSRIALDLKVALRAVIRSRFVSVLAIVAFALGIAVTTAVFSIFDGVLLAPLPFPETAAGARAQRVAAALSSPGVAR